MSKPSAYSPKTCHFGGIKNHQPRSRCTWLNLFINLFSIPGLYHHIIGQAGFPLGNCRRERFPFDTRNMDILHVAIWLHDHGLLPDDVQIGDIEQWARLVRGLPLDNDRMLTGIGNYPHATLEKPSKNILGRYM